MEASPSQKYIIIMETTHLQKRLQSLFPVLHYSSVSWGDYDNDGYLDILLTGMDVSGNRISKIYHNNGNSMFTEYPSFN